MGRPVDDNTRPYMIEDEDNNLQPLELMVFGEGSNEIHGAKIVDRFETPSSKSVLLDVGEFDDGMRKYLLAERFASDGWKWVNSFPEMDAMQMASYLEGIVRLYEKDTWDDSQEYYKGLLSFVEELRNSI